MDSFPLPNSIPEQLHPLVLVGFYPRLLTIINFLALSQRESSRY